MIQQFLMKALTVIAVVSIGLLSGCGGQEEEASAKRETSAETPAPANNPLAEEQVLMKDAQSLQGMIDKDAAAKKKTLEEATN